MNDKIDSEQDIRAFFDKLIKQLGMKKLTDIVIKKVDNKEEGRGISAFQMITTSHFAMHFDDQKRSGYIDIFSCKKFDYDTVVKEIKKHYQPKKIVSQMIFRDAGLSEKGSKNEDSD
jgi:S-adenosylmethionine/arginine decarboxylase-like enzyme